MVDRLPVRFDDGRGKYKIASMVDEHTRQSVLNMVERSFPAEDLVALKRSRSGAARNKYFGAFISGVPHPKRVRWQL
ncbi:hypothetical protein JCM9803A_03050 [Rhodococcus erythropolis]